MPKDLLDLAATPERLRALADAGILPPQTLERALELAVASPPRPWWRRFISTVLMGLGSLLVLSGVIYFFAFNWAALHRFGKIGLLMLAIAASAVAAWRLGEGLAGQFALLFAAVLVGPMLAVYGQAYQTGADPYELFIGWVLLILPWVALSRFGPLWLLLLVLANVGICLYWEQVLDWHGDTGQAALMLTLAGLNGLAWAVHEHFGYRNVAWLQDRWLPRVLSVMTLSPLLVLSEWMTVEPRDTTHYHVLGLVGLVAAAGGSFALHRLVRSELFLLTAVAMCAMTVLTTLVGRFLFSGHDDLDWFLSFFFMGGFILGEVALTVWWLRSESRLRGTEDV